MIAPDVNILVTAFRKDAPKHPLVRGWLEELVSADAAYAMSDLVLSGFLRVVTNPRVFKNPDPMPSALEFAATVRDQPNRVALEPGPRHWRIFSSLCSSSGVKGNLVSDAYLAALAIESGCEWVTLDGDYARFPGLRWQQPPGT